MQLQLERGLPRIIRTDNGKEYIGKAMLNWSGNPRDIQLKQIDPGKPNQNAYTGSERCTQVSA